MKSEDIVTSVKVLGHLALATCGVVALSFLVELTLGLVVGSQDWFLDYFVIGPTFALPIILGFMAGHRLGRCLPPLASRMLWVPPFVLLVSEIYTEYKYRWNGENFPVNLWNNYVGINCGGSECMAEALGTAPLVAALAYSLGAELGRRKSRKNRAVNAASSQ